MAYATAFRRGDLHHSSEASLPRCPAPAAVAVRCRVLLLTLALLGGGTTSGCALIGDPCAAPVTGTATYVSGSTAPPYHYEWSVRLEPSAGTVTYSPGYGSAESWSAPFTPEPDQVREACRQLRRESESDTPPGGGHPHRAVEG